MSQSKIFRYKIFFCAAGWLILVASLLPVRAHSVIGVQLVPQQPGPAIGADFTGLSFEMQRVLADTNGGHFFSPSNEQLIATFKELGIKSLRVGGNTADRPVLPTPTRDDVDHLFSFAKAADVKVIYTLRLEQGNPESAAEMADYIARRYPEQLNCFAIGNEPNTYSTNYQEYFSQWKQYAAQITASTNLPDARFSGPGVSPGHEKWSARFASDLTGDGHLKFISQHDYPGGDARSVTNPANGRDKLLSPAMDAHYARFAGNFVPAVMAAGLPYRFEEANSFYDGGALNVSDTFASALWALNFQWWWASHGISGINFHTGDKVAARDENKPCRYAAFWTVPGGYNVHPIGYAIKMFSLGSRGRMVTVKLQPESATNLNLAAYAILGDDKSFYVTLINKSHDASATNLSVQIYAQGITGWSKGEIIRLTASAGDVSRKTGVTLGGAEITDDGRWDGRWQPVAVPSSKLQFPIAVELPAASAALVKLTPTR